MTAMNTRILIVEDEFFIAETLAAMIEDMSLEVCGVAASADEALALAVQHDPAVVLMDMRLQGARDGVDAADAIQGRVAAKIIYVTGSQEPATIMRIKTDHPFAIVHKPFTFDLLQDTIRRALAA